METSSSTEFDALITESVALEATTADRKKTPGHALKASFKERSLPIAVGIVLGLIFSAASLFTLNALA